MYEWKGSVIQEFGLGSNDPVQGPVTDASEIVVLRFKSLAVTINFY